MRFVRDHPAFPSPQGGLVFSVCLTSTCACGSRWCSRQLSGRQACMAAIRQASTATDSCAFGRVPSQTQHVHVCILTTTAQFVSL